MRVFYTRALSDPVIGYLFTDVAQLDLEHHLPVIGDFWESTIFGTGGYARHRRNPLLIHGQLDSLEPLQPAHFQRWLALFRESVDQTFRGERATFLKMRSEAIAARMQEFLDGARTAAAHS